MVEYGINLDQFEEFEFHIETEMEEDGEKSQSQIHDPFPRQRHEFFDEIQDSNKKIFEQNEPAIEEAKPETKPKKNKKEDYKAAIASLKKCYEKPLFPGFQTSSYLDGQKNFKKGV